MIERLQIKEIPNKWIRRGVAFGTSAISIAAAGWCIHSAANRELPTITVPPGIEKQAEEFDLLQSQADFGHKSTSDAIKNSEEYKIDKKAYEQVMNIADTNSARDEESDKKGEPYLLGAFFAGALAVGIQVGYFSKD